MGGWLRWVRFPPGGHPGVGRRATWERWVAAALLVAVVVFGAVVVQRSAFGERRRTDAGVFFRAGYAVREGIDPYAARDDNGWAFLYAPGVAVLMAPLSDPPAGADRRGHLPYAVSVVLWYAMSVVLLFLAVHWAARAMEETSEDGLIRGIGPSQAGWWQARLWPMLVTLPDAGSTLSRGQINIHLVACMAGAMLLVSRGRWVWAGAAIGMGVFLKVLPGLLAVLPMARLGGASHRRVIAGMALMGVASGVALPMAAWGPEGAWERTETFVREVLLPGLSEDKEGSRQAGNSFAGTDNLSIQGSIHNVMHIRTPRGQRPDEPAWWVQEVHVAVCGALVLLTVASFRPRRERGPDGAEEDAEAWTRADRRDVVMRLAMLAALIPLAAPMTHRHYFIMVMPAVAVAVFLHIGRHRLAIPHRGGGALLGLYAALMLLPRFEMQGVLRDLPLPLVATLGVWGVCLWRLWQIRRGVMGPAAGPIRT